MAKSRSNTVKGRVFKKFKKYCEYYIDCFELNEFGFEYDFYDENDDEFDDTVFATVEVDHSYRVVYVEVHYNSRLKDNDKCEDVAKHEMIHVLLSYMSSVAKRRFVSEDEICAVEEATVNKLSKLL